MKKVTHDDLERIIPKNSIEDQDLETLRALSHLPIKSSDNLRYHKKFEDAQRRITAAIDKLEKKETPNWNYLFIFIGITGLIIGAISYIFPRN